MKNTLKYVDGFMLVMFLLWLSATDFEETTWVTWLAGAAVAGYLIFNGVRRYMSDGREETKRRPARLRQKNKR